METSNNKWTAELGTSGNYWLVVRRDPVWRSADGKNGQCRKFKTEAAAKAAADKLNK